jgi:hypothetical protein
MKLAPIQSGLYHSAPIATVIVLDGMDNKLNG